MEVPVTVLMAVYNDARYLPTAIQSILGQSFRDLRFLIVDDCSTDDSAAVIRSYADPRLELLRLERNVGQTAALNIGLRSARSEWIARMDADDYSAPERLDRQMAAAGRDAGIGCVGTAIWEFRDDPSVRERVITRPAGHADICRAALHGSGMIHGSILVRRGSLLACGGYDERYRYASDREMFIRLLRTCRATNLPDPLLGVRRHPGQDSFSVRAAEEYIDIFERLLSGNGHSGEERRILLGSLAYSHLFRGRCLRVRGDVAGWGREQWRALQISPRAWARNLLAAGKGRLLPARLQASLTRSFWK